MEQRPILSPETIAELRPDLELPAIRSMLMEAAACEWTPEMLLEVVLNGAPVSVGDIIERDIWGSDGQA